MTVRLTEIEYDALLGAIETGLDEYNEMRGTGDHGYFGRKIAAAERAAEKIRKARREGLL